MRRLGWALMSFVAGYVAYLVLIEIFIGVVGRITGGYPETLSPFFWPFAAPFLILPSEWRLTPVFDNVCSLAGCLLILMVAIPVYRSGQPRRNKSAGR